MVRAGRFDRALELLDAVWQRESADEHCWYYRLWILAGQGRVLEALALAREASGRLPGSGAIAWLQAALERSHGDRDAALEAALRGAAACPGPAGPEQLLQALLDERDSAPPVPRALPRVLLPEPPELPAPLPPWHDPVRAALAGAAFLFPFGSPRAVQLMRGGVSAGAEAPPPADRRADLGRLGLMAVATVIAAAVAVREPLLATAGLALTVAWLTRRGSGRSSPG